MHSYIFLTVEGYTYQPNSESIKPDIEKLQVIGFAKGISQDEAFINLKKEKLYLAETSFDHIICYKMDNDYKKSRKEFYLKDNYTENQQTFNK